MNSLQSLDFLKTYKEASKYFNISVSTLKNKVKFGKLVEGIDYKKISGIILFDIEGLGRFNKNLIGSKEIHEIYKIDDSLISYHKRKGILVEGVHYKNKLNKSIYDLEKVSQLYDNLYITYNDRNYKSLINRKFEKLTVVELDHVENNKTYWKCKCECGNYDVVSKSNLVTGKVKSCGCSYLKLLENNRKKMMIEDTNISKISSVKLNKNNNSGVKGVFFESSTGKWVATITFQKKFYKLGRFLNKEDAIKSRKEAEEKLHKNFLREKGLLNDENSQ